MCTRKYIERGLLYHYIKNWKERKYPPESFNLHLYHGMSWALKNNEVGLKVRGLE